MPFDLIPLLAAAALLLTAVVVFVAVVAVTAVAADASFDHRGLDHCYHFADTRGSDSGREHNHGKNDTTKIGFLVLRKS